MSEYSKLAEELNATLEARRQVSSGKSCVAPKDGMETEWRRLDQQAAGIREEIRRIRYGKQ